MGFFRKFLSLGSRRSKKRHAARPVETRPLSREEARRQQEEQEEVANRLLRSSSLRYAVVSEADYYSLPLPHPVNSLSQTPVPSLSRSASVQTRRTYTVTIRDRKVEALTEFPNANPPLDTPTHPSDDRSGEISNLQPVTPKDKNRLHMLRQDPSVASLLDMYDNKGCLDSKVFSNTPSATEKESPRDGRAQLKRGGSTLRQLLGNPESTNCTGSTESEISWAEDFLRERGICDDQSTASSFRPETPKDMVLGNGAFRESNLDTSPDSTHIVDPNTHHAISSMTVEPSYTSDDNPTMTSKRNTTESELRPAAEVFGFLLEKRPPRRSITMSRDSPFTAPPSAWDLNSSTSNVYDAPTTLLNPKQSRLHLNNLCPAEVSASADTTSTVGSILVDPPHTATILHHTRIPVAHGQLCEGSCTGQFTATAITTRASRIPRGRHSLQMPSSTWASTFETQLSPISPTEPVKPTLTPTCRSDALRSAINAVEHPSVITPHQDARFPPVPARSAHRRSVSHGSSRPIPDSWGAGLEAIRMARVKGLKSDDGNKENITSTMKNASMCSSGNPKSRLPVTPSRERALLCSAPSPTLSSDLSPVGQKMMADVRKQRQVRGERRKNRLSDVAVAHV